MRFCRATTLSYGHPHGALWARMHDACTPRRVHVLRVSWGWARICTRTTCACGWAHANCASARYVRGRDMGAHYARPHVRKRQQPPTRRVEGYVATDLASDFIASL